MRKLCHVQGLAGEGDAITVTEMDSDCETTMFLLERYTLQGDYVWDLNMAAFHVSKKKHKAPLLMIAAVAMKRVYSGLTGSAAESAHAERVGGNLDFLEENYFQTPSWFDNETEREDMESSEQPTNPAYYAPMSKCAMTLGLDGVDEENVDWVMSYYVSEDNVTTFYDKSLETKASEIDGADEGLFAGKAYKKGDSIITFPGQWMYVGHAQNFLDSGGYVFELPASGGWPLSMRTNVLYATYVCQANKINSAVFNGEQCAVLNCRMECGEAAPPGDLDKSAALVQQGLITAYATKDIAIGDEICTTYGSNFWTNKRAEKP